MAATYTVEWDGMDHPTARFVAADTRYLKCVDDAALSIGDIYWDMVAWVRTTTPANTQGIVSKWVGASWEYLLRVVSSQFVFTVRKADNSADVSVTATTFGTIPANAWCMVHVYHNPTTNLIGISVNVGAYNTAAVTGGVRDSTNDFRVGYWDGGVYYLDGGIGPLAIWKPTGTNLTAAQLTWLYNEGLGRDYSTLGAGELAGLVAWWQMDEVSGTRAGDVGALSLTEFGGVVGSEEEAFAVDLSTFYQKLQIVPAGRGDDLGSTSPGTATLVLNNNDGRFSPLNTQQPLYGYLKKYTRVRIKMTVGSDVYGLFYGYLMNMEIDTSRTGQTATWFLGDLFALWQEQAVNLPLLCRVGVSEALQVGIMRAGDRNKISNPSLEQSSTNWSAVGGGASGDRAIGTGLEGDYAWRVTCQGAASGEGGQYTATADFAAGEKYNGIVLLRASKNVTLRIIVGDNVLAQRGYVDVAIGPTTKAVSIPITPTADWGFGGASTSRFFQVITTTAVAVVIYVDALLVEGFTDVSVMRGLDIDAGTATVELVSAYREPALDILQAVAETEPQSFFYPWYDGVSERVRFRDQNYRTLAPVRFAFGKASIGLSTINASQDSKNACKFTLSVPTPITALWWYGKSSALETNKARGVIYADSAGAPGALLGASNEVTPITTALAWRCFTFATPVALAAGTYWLGVHFKSGYSLFYDAGTVDQVYYATDAYDGGSSDPWGATTSHLDWAMTIYASSAVVNVFSDDGNDYKWTTLQYKQAECISEAEVASLGTVQDPGVSTTMWELAPSGFLIPAGTQIGIHVRYSQPTRSVQYSIDSTPLTSFAIAQEDDAKRLFKLSATTPVVEAGLQVGMEKYMPTGEGRWRSYLRFWTEPIPPVALESAFLRLSIQNNLTLTPWILYVRDAPSWYTLDDADWTLGDGNPLLGQHAFLGVGEFIIDIPIDVSGIDKAGWSEFRLTSNRDEGGQSPTDWEWVSFDGFGMARSPLLIVSYVGGGFAAVALDNYGSGGQLLITAGALDTIVPAVSLFGNPLQSCSEDSLVVKSAPNPAPRKRTLSVGLPLQGTRTASMTAEATRLAARYDVKPTSNTGVTLLTMAFAPRSDADLRCAGFQLVGDLVHVENIAQPWGSWVDGDFWIEGIKHDISDAGKVHEITYLLEEK